MIINHKCFFKVLETVVGKCIPRSNRKFENAVMQSLNEMFREKRLCAKKKKQDLFIINFKYSSMTDLSNVL